MKKRIGVCIFFFLFQAYGLWNSSWSAQAASCRLASASESINQDPSNFMAYDCGGGGGGGGSGGTYPPPPPSPTPTPTPTPGPDPIFNYLENIHFDSNSDDNLPFYGLDSTEDIQLAMDIWNQKLSGCSSSILSTLVNGSGQNQVNNRIRFLTPASIQADYGIAAPGNNLAFTYFTAGPSTGLVENPTLDATTRFDIVFILDGENDFLPGSYFCGTSSNCDTTNTGISSFHLVFTVLLHELGHAMGLPDYESPPIASAEYDSVMNVGTMMVPGTWGLNLDVPTNNLDIPAAEENLGCN